MKRAMAVCIGIALLLAVIIAPGLPWSARFHRSLNRLRTKAEARIARWRGQQPRLVSITGKLTGHGAQVEALRGARVIAAESTSGYAAMCDGEGRFILPHLTWYPGASYNLIIAADEYHLKQLRVSAPPSCPSDGVADVGEVRFDDGYEVGRGDSPVRYMEYDRDNGDYYRHLCEKLTANSRTDEQAIDSINRYVAIKLNYKETALTFKSPRQILERGSCYCSNLALAMAAITAAGEYPTQTIHLSDSPEHQHTHVVVEVFYDDQWHLYDPTYGVAFLNHNGVVASYEELRLDPSLVTAKLALALATIAEAGDYTTRLVDLLDEAPHPAAHMVTEIYYGDRWHYTTRRPE